MCLSSMRCAWKLARLVTVFPTVVCVRCKQVTVCGDPDSTFSTLDGSP